MKVFGGRVESIVSGSAPLSSKVHEFLRVCFAYKVREGYGLTETTAGCCIQDGRDSKTGQVGPPSPSVEINLIDVPEMNYTSKDKPCPRGEICIRGPIVTPGYYKNPEKTKEAFIDGWLHTGDVGRINEDGTVSIIDRKKNIFKLSQGEYIAPEYLENIFCRSSFVAQCFVFGDSYQAQLVAVIIPDEEKLLNWAKKNNISGDFKSLCSNPRVKELILENMTKVGKESKLNGFEFVKDIHLDFELWTNENGILTPTLKLKRNDCYERYKKYIELMYDNLRNAPKTE